MKYKDIEALSDQELDTKIEEMRDRLRVARFDRAIKEVENVRFERNTRRHLAQLLTTYALRRKTYKHVNI